MKLLKNRRKHRVLMLKRRRARKQLIRQLIRTGVLRRIPPEYRGGIVLRAPKVLSIDNNFQETIEFLISIKKLGGHLVSKHGRLSRQIRFAISLSDVEHISVRSAVLFTAEVDRLRRRAGLNLEYTGKASTSEDVTSILAELGCFSLMDIDHPESSAGHTNSRKTLIKMLSGRRLESGKFEEFDAALTRIFSNYQSLPPVYVGMAEALLNIRHHAYLPDVKLKYTCPGNRWWATACVDKVDQSLRIFVFDQGVGIPATLPYSGFIERAESFLKGIASGQSHDDATLLKGALEYSRSRTGTSGRGKGFRDIMSSIDQYGGRLRIASGKAEVTYCGQDDIVTVRRNHHVGGTLIEWALPMRIFERAQGESNEND